MEKNQHLIHATDMLLSLAAKLPDNLMLDAKDAEGIFTFALLQRLSDEQLANLRKAANFYKYINVFLYFYIRYVKDDEDYVFEAMDIDHTAVEAMDIEHTAVEFKDFKNFDFEKIICILFNEKLPPALIPNGHYVTVTLVVKA